MKEVTQQLFQYDDYRSFLKDYFNFMKKRKAAFTLNYFAQKAGFNSASFCMYVIDGRRNLSIKSIPKMIKGLGLKGKHAQFFESLVLLNQSSSIEEQERYRFVVNKLRKTTKYYKLQRDQSAYFEEWYYPVIRELAVYSDWGGNFEKLGNMLLPTISREKAKKAVELLTELKFLKLEPSGKYIQFNPAITGTGVPAYIIKAARRNLLLKGIDAADKLNSKERHISLSTLSLSPNNYHKMDEMMTEFHNRLAEMAAEDDGKKFNRVYQINLQAFPFSKREEKQ